MASLKFRHYATENALKKAGTVQDALNEFDVGTIVFIDDTQKQYIITSKSNNVVTYKIYYGEAAVVGVSGSGATRTLTFSDGSEIEVKINDVEHATSADTADIAKSVAWANVTNKPNLVTTDTEQTITGIKIFNNNTTFKNETDVESLTADSLLVTGSARFTNIINGNLKGDVEGNLTGNASSATTAAICTGNSATATALTTNAGSTNRPVYFTGGKPSAISITAGTANAEQSLVVVTDNNELYKTSGITANYANKSITATTFKGNLEGNAATATTALSCSGNSATSTTATTAITATSLGSGALKYMCSLYTTNEYNAYKIVTDWHKSYNIMPTINIRGYSYGNKSTIDCDIVMYHFNNISCNYSLTNKGSYSIRVWQAIENDVQVFYINPGVYYGMFNVFVYGGIGSNVFTNWTMTPVDEVSGTEIESNPIATSITGNAASATIASSCTGNAGTATEFFENKSITLSGDITGSASSKGGWSIATTITDGAITNAKLTNSKITIAETEVSLGGSIAASTIGNALTSDSPAAYATNAGTAVKASEADKATKDSDGNNINTTYLKTVTLASGTNNGTLKLTVGSITTDNIAVKGLGSAAYTDSESYATASHIHNYLPLSGGTMTGQLVSQHTFYNDACYVWRNTRQEENGGGRADSFIKLQKADGTFNASFGTYGNNENDNYIYIGYDEKYNGLNLRISTTSLFWGNNPLIHSGNYNSYTPTLTGIGATGTWKINITGTASSAIKATSDSNGNTITSTYATKTERDNNDITAVSLSATKLTLTRAVGNITANIPIWNQDTTGTAAKATADANGNNIVNTYATKAEVAALPKSMVIRGTLDVNHKLPTSGMSEGDTYIVGASGIYNNITCKVGDFFVRTSNSWLRIPAGDEWEYNENTIKAIKVNNAGHADTAGIASAVAWVGITGKPNLVTIDTEQTIIGNKSFKNETSIESLTVDSLIVTGSARFTNGLSGNLTGIATYADKIGSSSASYTYDQLNTHFTESITNLSNLTDRVDKSELVIGNKLSSIENGLNDLHKWTLRPRIEELDTKYINVSNAVNLNGNILDTDWIDACNMSISSSSQIPTINSNVNTNTQNIEKTSLTTSNKLAEHEEQIKNLIDSLNNPNTAKLVTQLLTVMEAINLGGIVIRLNGSGMLEIDGDLIIKGATYCE